MVTETSFVIYWRLLNIALVAQGEPEATLSEARRTYEAEMAEADARIALQLAA
jgi:hypothetical protein